MQSKLEYTNKITEVKHINKQCDRQLLQHWAIGLHTDVRGVGSHAH